MVGGQLALLGARWRAELFGHYWTPSSATSDANAAVGVRVQGWELGARGCGVLAASIVEVPLCAGLAAGGLHGEGEGELRVERAASPWVRALVGPALRVRVLDRLWLGGRVEGFALLAAGHFTTEPSGEVYRPRAGGLTATLDVEIRLP